MTVERNRDPHELAGEYVVGTLSAEERRALEQVADVAVSLLS